MEIIKDYEGSVADHVGIVLGQPHTCRGQTVPPLGGSVGLWDLSNRRVRGTQ